MVVGFVTVGYALYLRYLAIELSTVALACDAGLLAGAALYTGFNEGPNNWQSLWTCAMYFLFAVTLWRARVVQIPK